MANPKHIWVFDNPRARSHVFFRWIRTHPTLQPCYYPYVLPAHFGPENFYNDVRVSERRRKIIDELSPQSQTDDSYDAATDAVEAAVNHVEAKGARLLVGEHCHRVMEKDALFSAIRDSDDFALRIGNNVTRLSEQLLANFTPVFVIRSPILAISSFYAAMASLNLGFEPTGEDMIVQTSLRYCRMIFEYYHAATGKAPLVVDGEDITWRGKEIGTKLCGGLGFSAEGMRDTWEPTPDAERPSNPYIWRFTQDMHESTGIRQSNSQPNARSIEDAAKDWQRDYGDEVAGQLRAVVGANMEDYLYLSQFKL